RTQVGGVDRRGLLLQGAHVVDGVAPRGDEVRVGERYAAAGPVAVAGQSQPWVFDQRRDGFAGGDVWADANYLDGDDAVSPDSRVMTFVAAEFEDALGRERRVHVLGTAGQLFVGTGGAHRELRGLAYRHLRSHRCGAVGCVEQIEPEQDARPAGTVHLLALQ